MDPSDELKPNPVEEETVPSSIRSRIEELYHQGQMLQAYELAKPFGPLPGWTGARSRTWAGRLAGNLGSHRLARILHRRNYRRHRHDFEAAAYHAHNLLQDRGPLVARQFLASLGKPGPEVGADARQHLLTLHALVAAAFRDFDSAEAHLLAAREVLPDSPWLCINEAALLEKEDRYEEALAAAQRSLAKNPNYRPGIQEVAHLLQVLDRDAEALDLLAAAAARIECGPVAAQMAVLLMDLERLDESWRAFDRFLALSPLADKSQLDWVVLSRIALARCMGNLELTRELCRDRKEPFHRELLKRLEAPDPPRRRLKLKVDFVRQHHLTCAPATLTAIAKFWGQPAEHLDLAEAICYDGTSSHSERRWAETHGYAVREFTVTWEAAVTLLDGGIPFTLATHEATRSHLQAVIGYDEINRSLLLRDPFYYYTSEALCPIFLERYAAFGPRGLALVPLPEAHRLAGLELPDCALYDLLHRLNCALDEHRRQDAAGELAALKQQAPDHRLTRFAGWSLAAYDANVPASLGHLDKLLETYPKDGALLLAKWGCLSELASRAERLHFLEDLVERRVGDIVFFMRLATELRQDARELPRACELAGKALRLRPTDPDFLRSQADLLWDRQQ